jgi:hypothetical protein
MTAADPSSSSSLTTSTPPDDTGTKPLPNSPHAMAQAVLDEAIAERDRQSHHAASESTETGSVENDATSNKRPRLDSDQDDKNIKEQLKKLWQGNKEWKEDDANEALDATTKLVYGQIESLIRSGLEAYHQLESTRRDLSQAKEECEAKDRELRRLRALSRCDCNCVPNPTLPCSLCSVCIHPFCHPPCTYSHSLSFFLSNRIS